MCQIEFVFARQLSTNVMLTLFYVNIGLFAVTSGFSVTKYHRHCCDIGKQWYSHSGNVCSPHPMLDSSSKNQAACALVIDVCCVAELRRNQCQMGRQYALSERTCDSASNPDSINTDHAKECCSCCQLGMMAREANSSTAAICSVPDHYSCQCKEAYLQCCQDSNSSSGSGSSSSRGSSSGRGSSSSTSISSSTSSSSSSPNNIQMQPHLQPDTNRTSSDGLQSTSAVDDQLELTEPCQDGLHACSQICNVGDRGTAQCSCRKGYKLHSDGKSCIDVDECRESIHNCSRRHRCMNNEGGFTCQLVGVDPRPTRQEGKCQPGFMWSRRTHRCEDINECLSGRNACKKRRLNCLNSIGSYSCISPEQTSSTVAPSSPLSIFFTRRPNPTPERWTTESGTNNRIDFTSTISTENKSRGPACKAGYFFNQSSGRCEDIDECRTIGCRLANMKCRNTIGSFACHCESGFNFNPRNRSCEDINECTTARHKCLFNEKCENTFGSYVCRSSGDCARGFLLDKLSHKCTDVDECALKPDICPKNSRCLNTRGSYRCALKTCEPGMKLEDNGNCIDIDECEDGSLVCRPNQECTNTLGSYFCRNLLSCGVGFEMNSEGTRCEDVDECEKDLHDCHGSQMFCVNRPGTFTCQCPDGYQVDAASHTCQDIDECAKHGGQVCAQNSRCENTPGSFRCLCQAGFEMDRSTRFCQDIDECKLWVGVCQHGCRNTWGSFYCTCNEGYQISSDGRTCTDVDECRVMAADESSNSVCLGICENTPGSYHCSCPEGYRQSSDGRSCQDIDECVSERSCFRRDDVCVNTGGNYYCQTIQCPSGFIKSPKLESFRPQVGLDSRTSARSNSYGLDRSRFERGLYRSRFENAPTTSLPLNSIRGVAAKPVLFISNEDSGIVCQKVECPANDIACIMNLTRSIQWQFVSLPSIPKVSEPMVIITIQPIIHSIHPYNDFSIIGGNERGLFDVVKQSQSNQGNVRLIKPITGPAKHILTLQVKNRTRYNNTISEHLAYIIVNVSKYRF